MIRGKIQSIVAREQRQKCHRASIERGGALNNSPRSLRTRRTALLRLTATRSRRIFESYRTRDLVNQRALWNFGPTRSNNLSWILVSESSSRAIVSRSEKIAILRNLNLRIDSILIYFSFISLLNFLIVTFCRILILFFSNLTKLHR